MDLVGVLATQLHLEEDAAASLGGGLLLLVEELARERLGDAVAEQLRVAVPELGVWQSSAPPLPLGLEGLPPAAPPGDEGEFANVLARFGLDATKTPIASMLLMQFLARRLEPAMVDSLVGAIPSLG